MAMTEQELQVEQQRALRRLQAAAFVACDLGITNEDIQAAVNAGLDEARRGLELRQPYQATTPQPAPAPEPGSAMAALLRAGSDL